MPRPSRSNLGLLVVGLGTVVAPLDTAVNIAFPSITRAFVLEVEDIRWVVIAYVLTYASLMLVFGKLGDLLGYRRIFQLGKKPSPRVSPAPFSGCQRDTHDFGNLGHRQPGEEAEIHQLGLGGIFLRQLVKRIVESQQVLRRVKETT